MLRQFYYNTKKFLLLYFMTFCLTLSGCGSAESDEVREMTVTVDDESGLATGLETDGMFTDRDMTDTYEEEGADSIELTGGTASCSSTKVSIVTNTVFILDEGVYIISGTLEGMIIVDAGDDDKVQLVLDGAEITSDTSAAIYVKNAGKTFITTAEGSENVLSNGGEYESIDDSNIDSVIFSRDDLTLNGLGTLTVYAKAGHGVVSKDDLKVTGGTLIIEASEHGLQANDSIRVGGGDITISCGEDGLHSENDDDDTLGYVYMEAGSLEIEAGDDGIHAGYAVLITGGTIDVTDSYEGIEGLSVEITGGEISVSASDDGINAAGGTDESGFGGMGNDIFSVTEGAFIVISGGSVYVDASGDGVDSNGDLLISGGEIYISGPTGNMDGIIDYSGSAQITGGTLIAAGSSGMAESFDSSSTQGVLTVSSLSGSAGTSVVLYDSAGEMLLSWEPYKNFEMLILSCGELTVGETYTLSVGGVEQEITMDSLTGGNSYGGGAGGFGGFFGGGTGRNRNGAR